MRCTGRLAPSARECVAARAALRPSRHTSYSVQARTRRLRLTRRTTHTTKPSASTHGTKNASATPIIRTLHINAAAPCPSVRRIVPMSPLHSVTMFPWLYTWLDKSARAFA